MPKTANAPLLSRVKSWQFIGLGLSGWCTLYSVALLTWGASSTLIGNAQGGCFAATMTLASLEARRYRKCLVNSADSLDWTGGISTEHLNRTLAEFLQQREFRVEHCRQTELEMGFGVRGVNTGRTVLFETARWKEAVIDLEHVQTTEENREKLHASLAVIVGAGQPAETAEDYVKTHDLQLLVGQELKDLLKEPNPPKNTA